MSSVRIGLIGLGNIGKLHMGYFSKIDDLEFVAASDLEAEKREKVKEEHKVEVFENGMEMIQKADINAVLIATPHYDHVPLAIAAMEKGIHVLTEKPIAVTAQAAQEVIDAHKKYPEVIYAAMFNQRANPAWRKVKDMVAKGMIGKVQRATWIVTNWFRTQRYYDSGGWRATWEGEGGGVLLNQCPHNLDLYTWIVGSPKKVTAIGGIGKYHNIEVEDDIHALLEFENGAVGHFITTTGEAPGTNRLEIAGDMGKIIADRSAKITFVENEMSATEYSNTTDSSFGTPKTTEYEITLNAEDLAHEGITRNFVDAIINGKELIAPGEEGIRGLELGNAMLMSMIQKKTIEIPTPREEYDQMIKDLAKNSTFKKEVKKSDVDMGASLQK